jgi:hypothetical protein
MSTTDRNVPPPARARDLTVGAPAGGPQGSPAAMNPDCRDGKHRACSGTAWDDERDELAACPCSCHSATTQARTEQEPCS